MQPHCADQSDSAVACEQVCSHHQRVTVACMMSLRLRLSHSGRLKKKGTRASRSWHWGSLGVLALDW